MEDEKSPISDDKIIEIIVTVFVLAVFIFLFSKIVFF